MHHFTCVQCGAPFDAVRNDARFCSPGCRLDAHRGAPPRQQPRAPSSAPSSAPQEPPKEPPPLDPTRRAWLSIEGRRCWFVLNWDPKSLANVFDSLFVTASAHEDHGQWWIGNNHVAVDSLRYALRHVCRAEVFDYPHGGSLPSLFLLELMSSPNSLERAIYELLMATPPERRRKMIKGLAACAHPDGQIGYRSLATDHLLEICLALKDDPDLG